MNGQEALVAARTRAQLELADRIVKTAGTVDHETAAAVAGRFLADLEAEGWHHVAAHTAAPAEPARSDPPSEAYRAARDQLERRQEVSR